MAGDPYEQRYMQGTGVVLHRVKVTPPRSLFLLSVGMPFVGGLIATLALALIGAPLFATLAPVAICGLVSAGLLPLMILFGGGRVAVSEGEIHVQIGPLGPKIPIADIASCEVGSSGTRRYGMGAGKALDGTVTYRMFGDNDRAVRLTKTDGSRVIIVCPEAEHVVAAVHRAMAVRAVPATRVAEEEGEVAEASAAERRARDTAR